MGTNSFEHTESYEWLLAGLKREWRIKFGFFWLTGFAALYLFFCGWNASTGHLAWYVFAFIFGLGCLGFGWTCLRSRRAKEHRLFYYIKENPRHIVWVYSILKVQLPFGFQVAKSGTLYFKLADGDEISVGLPEHQLKLVSESLNAILPHASFGYSQERDQLFSINPALLVYHEDD